MQSSISWLWSKYSVFIVLFLIVRASSGQQALNGYVVLMSGERIEGEINFKSFHHNSSYCDFKPAGNGSWVTYQPEDIKCYRLEEGNYFFAKEVEVNGKKEDYFLELLLEGVVNLYSLKLATQHTFFIEKQGELTQLSNEDKTLISDQGVERAGSSKKYIGALIYLFQDAPELKDDITYAGFGSKPLVNLTKKYHNAVCEEGQLCIDYTKTIKPGVYLEPFFGYVRSKMYLKTSSDVSKNANVYGGFNIRVVPSQLSNLWNFKIGISLAEYDFRALYTNALLEPALGGYLVSEILIEVDYKAIHLPVILERHFNIKKWQPGIFLGIENVLLIDTKSSMSRLYGYDYQGNAIFVGISEPLTEFKTYQLGGIAGINFKYDFNTNWYGLLSCEYARRYTLRRNGAILDVHNVESIKVNLGFGVAL